MIEQFLADNFLTIVISVAALWTLVWYMVGRARGITVERNRDSYRKAYRERTELIREQMKGK